MAARTTGFAMLCAASVQEAQDFALISTHATLESRIPFLHLFDGVHTSHEVDKVETLTTEDLEKFIPIELVITHRSRALTPDRPVLRGKAQKPDVYFQARATVNPFYLACPDITQKVMDEFAQVTGREYKLFEYHGDPTAEKRIILMGSACKTVHKAVDYLNKQCEKVGVVIIRLYRPFDTQRFINPLPEKQQYCCFKHHKRTRSSW
jgi:pyruvate-ferredoxin/flavodoxin oxidoreductase